MIASYFIIHLKKMYTDFQDIRSIYIAWTYIQLY